MDILKFPHPLLFEPTRQVTVFGPELSVLLHSMWETMIAAKGLGLAANQVGLPWNMFVMEGPNKERLFIVNPVIASGSKTPANLREGCLSAPGEFLILKERMAWVEIAYSDENGAINKGFFKGIHAVCVQHEMDHLVGKSHLQSKSISRAERKRLAKKWGLK